MLFRDLRVVVRAMVVRRHHCGGLELGAPRTQGFIVSLAVLTWFSTFNHTGFPTVDVLRVHKLKYKSMAREKRK